MGKEKSSDIRPVGKVAFAAPGFEAEIPIAEAVSPGKPVEIIIDGVTQECAGTLSRVLETNELLVDHSGLCQKFLDALRLANTFEIGIVGSYGGGDLACMLDNAPFKTPDKIEDKILTVLKQVLSCVEHLQDNTGINSMTVTIRPDWGCTEAMPEQE